MKRSAAGDAEWKGFASLEIKDAAKGEVEAVVATIGVIDHDEEIIRAGAIKSGSPVTMSGYGHDAAFGATPVGRGTLNIDGNRAVFRGRMFMSTQRGRETFDVLKEMGSNQEWSFGFHVTGAETPTDAERKAGARRVITKLDAFEVSPVLLGAGINTGTLGLKGATVETDPPLDPPLDPPMDPPVETPPTDPPDTKAQLVRDLVAELKVARETAARLETEQANAVAKEIFDRFRKNFKSA